MLYGINAYDLEICGDSAFELKLDKYYHDAIDLFNCGECDDISRGDYIANYLSHYSQDCKICFIDDFCKTKQEYNISLLSEKKIYENYDINFEIIECQLLSNVSEGKEVVYKVEVELFISYDEIKQDCQVKLIYTFFEIDLLIVIYPQNRIYIFFRF